MVKLYDGGAYLLNGTTLVADDASAEHTLKEQGISTSKEEAAKNTMAYGILEAHNTSGNMEGLKIKFDKMTSASFRPQGLQDLRSFLSLMCLQTVITHFAQLEEP